MDALRELDGNFIKSRKIGGDIVVSFHNPSVKDFMEQFLAQSDTDVVDLFRGAQFYEHTPRYGLVFGAVATRESRGPVASFLRR